MIRTSPRSRRPALTLRRAALPLACLAALATGCTDASSPSAPADASAPTDAGHDRSPAIDAGTTPAPTAGAEGAWRFVVVGDTHVTESGAPIAAEMVPAILADAPKLVLVVGDIVQAGKACSAPQLAAQIRVFQALTAPLSSHGIPVYPVRGNHEADAEDSAATWRAAFSGTNALPANGPSGETGLSYSVAFDNALFVAVDEYVTIHQANQAWLDALFASNARPHVFVFGHEPAFKNFHTDCMGSVPAARNAFWTSLANAGAKVYLTAHDHFRDLTRIDDGDGDPDDDLFQYTIGTGGGPFPPAPGAFDGDNAPFTPVNVAHAVENGYLVVEVSGATATDRAVSMTFKRRTCDDASACTYPATADVFRYVAK